MTERKFYIEETELRGVGYQVVWVSHGMSLLDAAETLKTLLDDESDNSRWRIAESY